MGRAALSRVPSAVLVDMDGTLLDSEKIWDVSLSDLAASLGGTLSARARAAMVGSNLYRSVDLVYADLGLDVGVDADRERSAQFLTDRTAQLFAAGLEWRPGAEQLLQELTAAAVPTVLVTSTARALTELALDTLGREHFVASVCGDEVAHPKPAPDPYLRAAELVGLPASACVAIEDSPTGVASARAAGCAVLAVPGEVPIAPGPGCAVRDGLVGLSLGELAELQAAAAGHR